LPKELCTRVASAHYQWHAFFNQSPLIQLEEPLEEFNGSQSLGDVDNELSRKNSGRAMLASHLVRCW
jgi:hypothetical protein